MHLNTFSVPWTVLNHSPQRLPKGSVCNVSLCQRDFNLNTLGRIFRKANGREEPQLRDRWRSCPNSVKRILKTQLGKPGNSNCASKQGAVRWLGNCNRLTSYSQERCNVGGKGSITHLDKGAITCQQCLRSHKRHAIKSYFMHIKPVFIKCHKDG